MRKFHALSIPRISDGLFFDVIAYAGGGGAGRLNGF